jgi:hypothetical protein
MAGIRKVDRRTFFGAAAGVAGATALGPLGPGLSFGHDHGHRNTINIVSKKLQSPIVCLDAALKQIKGVISYIFRSTEKKASMLVSRLQNPLHLVWT